MVGCSSSMPRWLEAMLGERFFSSCMIHETSKKKEKNIFCLDCCSSFCPQCLSPHRPHRLLQVRRYVYHDVLRVDDLEKLIDCSSVQSYTTNNAKVVFLNERPRGRQFRSSGNACLSCHRSLQEPFFFCSLSCKVRELGRSEGGLWRELRECEHLPLPSSCELEEGQPLTPDSVLDPATAATSTSSVGAVTPPPSAVGMEAISQRKKKRSSRPRVIRTARPDVSNRPRKRSAPVRAPLF